MGAGMRMNGGPRYGYAVSSWTHRNGGPQGSGYAVGAGMHRNGAQDVAIAGTVLVPPCISLH